MDTLYIYLYFREVVHNCITIYTIFMGVGKYFKVVGDFLLLAELMVLGLIYRALDLS